MWLASDLSLVAVGILLQLYLNTQRTIMLLGGLMETVTMQKLYSEVRALKEDIEYMKKVLVPEEKISAKELKELEKAKAEALSEKTYSIEEAFSE